ncbi:MAG TPA: amino acid adenylation domain-containing protein [Pyrinomonadaceae bacterium]|nr:amino acid adenylation domain-containing protein [Pyrinomonadaceae bacterium]
MQYQISPELESVVEATSGPTTLPATLTELLDQRAAEHPDQLAYTFLLDGETSELHLSYAELKRRACSIAAALRRASAKGERALLLYPPGLDFIEGFFGCLYAGIVAVPAYPPHFAKLNRNLPRLRAIIADAQARFVLTTSPVLERAKPIFTEAPDLKALQWLATDTITAGDWEPEHATANDLAFLQYTSGSTGHPRGVMLTHANLLHNASLIFHVFEHTETDSYVSWLPMFHDMGFMVGVLQPLYAGIRAVVMSPAAFLQRPARWLEAIARYRATTSGGPNFAYDLCARKITDKDAAALDLSTWSVAFNGAEPVRAETLDRFTSRFERCGFRRAAFYPCYGLAEATLIVTGGHKKSLPIIKRVETTSKLMVGCGSELPEERIVIVDPASLTELKAGQVGEIWVSGPSVAKGYWNRSEETHQIFNAYLSGTGEGPFLRTEDLGFIEDGELYVTGRIKDLIIIRGLNHYPQDIEWTVERCHTALRPGCGAAFTIEAGGEERLVVVQEIDTREKADLDQVIDTIREAVALEHDLQVHAVALIKPGQVSKTSSGKIQRRATRRKFLDAALDAVAKWHATVSEESDAPELMAWPLSAEAINSWLASQVAAKLGIAPFDVRMDQPLARYGLDSLIAIELAHSIETSLGVMLPMVSFLQGTSIAQLSAHVLSRLNEHSGLQALPTASSESENEYPLSYGQRGLWFLHNLAPESTAYNIARAVKIRALLDVAALQRAISALLDRHAALRTTFATSQGRPIQRVTDQVEPEFQQEDAPHLSDDQLDERLSEESERPFDLEHGPLLRIHLFTRSSDEHILLLAAHHIIVDFWSLALLMRELGPLYEAEQSGVRAALPTVSSSYSAFVRWQRELLSSDEGETHWTYWRNQLSGELPVLNLPTTRPRPPVQSFRGASIPLRLSAAIVRGMKALSCEHGATLYMTLLAAFQALLYRYTGQEELLVGSVTAGRARAEFASLIGYFVNPLVLRSTVSRDETFEFLLAQVRQTVLDAFEHQDYPFSTLVERLQVARDPSRSPLFQVMFSMHKTHLPGDEGLSLFALGEAGARMNLGGLELISVPLKRRVAQFDLTLMMAEAGEELYASFEYNTDLFDAATIEQMAQSFRTLLEAVVANPAEKISRLPLLGVRRLGTALAKAPTSRRTPRGRLNSEKTIDQLFEQQTATTPEAIAVVFGEQRLSYRELNARANKLARHLRRLGVGPEALVAICVERSAEMLVGLLGILKAGGAYVPLDTSYPQERIAFLLDDARVGVLVTQADLLEKISDHNAKVICIDRDWKEIERESDDNLDSVTTPDNAAYVIYTSGSTGWPKGVVVSHHNVLRLFVATRSWFDFSHRDVWTLFHSYAFDFSVWELWGALLYGGRVVVVPYFVSRTPEAFRELLRREGVTVLNQTPSAFHQLMFTEESAGEEADLDLRLVIFGGEALELQSLRPWLERHGDERPQLVNMYGITETTVHVTYRRIRMADLESGRRSVIGAAIPDLQVYVLDQYQQPVPMGVAGELCVAGDGLARGYLHQPALTAQRFIADPFGGSAGARLYRSGDLARQLSDGEIEYLGRIDQQVKIRGFRVEPGEIEATLNEHPAVRESVVVAREEATGDKRLVAYVVTKDGEQFSAETLRDHLRERLPDYMLPAVFVEMKALPLTLNGKIDRRALPSPDGIAVRPKKSFEAPRTETEQTLADIWSEVLGIKPVGVNDNFFEMGGDSILSIQIVARAKEAGIYLTPKQLFQHQTISKLSQLTSTLPEARESTSEELGPVKLDQRQLEKLTKLGAEIEDTYPLTPTQQGILFHSLSEPESGVYTTQFICELTGGLDEEALQAAWQTVVRRYQSLRADFAWDVPAEPIQIVRREVEMKLNREDWTQFSRERQEEFLEEYLRYDRERGFDFKRAPLLRLALFSRSDEEYVFIFSHHHLLIDGWSLSIILQEVFAIYDAGRDGHTPGLKEPRSFKDYITWLGQQDQAAAENFWRETLNGFTEPTSLGIDNPNLDAEQGYSEQSLHLSETATESLQAFARQNQLTLSTLLYGAWSILLSRYSGERDVVFGVTSSGRPPDLSGSETMVGLFINTLPLRVSVPSGQLLIPWLKELQERLVELRQYEYSSLVQVQEWSDAPRGRALFENIFVFENYPVDSSLAARRERPEITNVRSIEQTNYPLTIAAVPGAELSLHAGYKTDRFDSAAICRMLRHLETLLEGMIARPQQRVSELPILSAAERDVALSEWNETHTDFPNLTLHELFERQAEATPDAVALIFEGERLSYRELNQRAKKLAQYLQSSGVTRGALVGVCLQRSPEMIVSLLGILKAGAAYVILDPDYPKERLAYMLADAQPSLVVYPQTTHITSAPSVQSVETSGDDLAYVIYTSGSTGQPKGVMISHSSISNHMQWFAREFPLVESDRLLLNHSISFDAAVDQIFQPLITGAGLVIVPPDRQYDIDYLVQLIREEQVTVLDVVPTLFKALIGDERIRECRSLRRAISSGEVFSAALKNSLYRLLPQIELANLYGPTEASITATYYRCSPETDERTVPIGRSVANTQVYILDENLEPLPPDIAGEIYIGGSGLAWGYLNRPQLTAEKFIPDPFSTELGARLYKSGDLGKYSANGNIEYVGRVDTQVKVRGFRIELGEIEAKLREHEAVRDAVVITREDENEHKRLVAYIIAGCEPAVTPAELRRYLKDKLPEHMLPAAVVFLDRLPLMPSGKVDVRALPAPEEIKTEENYVAPRTSVEKEFARIWQEVLGVEQVGITDNFFELGGDSIVSIQIVARARDAGLSITPKQVLQHASISELAAITKISRALAAEEELGEGTIPLTPIQHWFFEQELPDPHHYNQAVMLELKQPASADLLKKTFEQLIEHHDALRLRFEHDARGWQQTIAACETQQVFARVDLSSFTPEAQTTEIKTIADHTQSSLDLSDGPITRGVYFDLGATRLHRLLIVIHHLAVDGVSWRILLDDMQRAYEQLQRGEDVALPLKTLSFKRWSELINAHAQSDAVRRELEYWTTESRHNVGKLPVDLAGDNTVDSARSLSVFLTAEETRLLLQEVPRAYQTQINDVLLAALAQALTEWTSEKRVLVDVEGHGREEIVESCDLSRTVGWFTTIFPVLLEVSNSSAPGETLKSVKEQLRRVPNRGIGYGLLRYLRGDEAICTQLEKFPQAQVSFNYLGQLDQVFRDESNSLECGGLAPLWSRSGVIDNKAAPGRRTPRTRRNQAHFALTNDPVGQSRGKLGRRKYLIEIDGAVRDGRLQMEWVYSEELHAQHTIEAVAESFIRKLRKLIEHCVLREVREYTPSDFPLAHLNERQLAQIQRTAGPIEDLYPLSPMQEGMLFHSLYGSDNGIYTTQLVCELKGRLHEEIFGRAWQAAVDAHAVLRTSFEWEAVEEPVQVVRRSVKVRLKREDWKSLGRLEQEENFEKYLRQEREQEFDLKQSPLMRLAVVRTADDKSLFIWTSHHLLLDGWSLPIVLRDVLTAYDRLRRGEQASVKPERGYRDYITWIKKQDLREAESFWRQLLKGFKSPTPLPNRGIPSTGDSLYAEQHIQLPESATARLQRFAQRHQLTQNTVAQGAWALLLSSLSRTEDVVFGVVVSGRSAQVAEIESMVGLFINTLPARATITTDAELTVWLKQLQAQQAEISQYEYSPLTRVQAWSEVEPGKPLFESIFVFENYPVGNAAAVYGDLRVGSIRSVERSNYPLTVWAIPGRELVLRIGYDKGRFHDELISQLLQDYQALLEQISEALWVKDLLPTKKHKIYKMNC